MRIADLLDKVFPFSWLPYSMLHLPRFSWIAQTNISYLLGIAGAIQKKRGRWSLD
jgi:hypothetical protein